MSAYWTDVSVGIDHHTTHTVDWILDPGDNNVHCPIGRQFLLLQKKKGHLQAGLQRATLSPPTSRAWAEIRVEKGVQTDLEKLSLSAMPTAPGVHMYTCIVYLHICM